MGDGVFGAALIISLVALYLGTKDRWRWKRIATWAIGVAFVAFFALGAWVGWLKWDESRPKLATEYWGIALGMPAQDVLFAKGEPHIRDKDDRWQYDFQEPNSGGYSVVVLFRDGKVVGVLAFGDRVQLPLPGGLSSYIQLEEALSRYGVADHVGQSTDGQARTFTFKRFNTVLVFDRTGLIGAGMLAPNEKPRTYGRSDQAQVNQGSSEALSGGGQR